MLLQDPRSASCVSCCGWWLIVKLELVTALGNFGVASCIMEFNCLGAPELRRTEPPVVVIWGNLPGMSRLIRSSCLILKFFHPQLRIESIPNLEARSHQPLICRRSYQAIEFPATLSLSRSPIYLDRHHVRPFRRVQGTLRQSDPSDIDGN